MNTHILYLLAGLFPVMVPTITALGVMVCLVFLAVRLRKPAASAFNKTMLASEGVVAIATTKCDNYPQLHCVYGKRQGVEL